MVSNFYKKRYILKYVVIDSVEKNVYHIPPYHKQQPPYCVGVFKLTSETFC